MRALTDPANHSGSSRWGVSDCGNTTVKWIPRIEMRGQTIATRNSANISGLEGPRINILQIACKVRSRRQTQAASRTAHSSYWARPRFGLRFKNLRVPIRCAEESRMGSKCRVTTDMWVRGDKILASRCQRTRAGLKARCERRAVGHRNR